MGRGMVDEGGEKEIERERRKERERKREREGGREKRERGMKKYLKLLYEKMLELV